MLNLKFIQENKETVIERLAVKNFDARESVEKIIALDNQRKSLQQEAEAKQAQMNIIAKEIGKLMQSGQKEAAEKARQETADLKSAIAGLNSRRTEVSNELTMPLWLKESLKQTMRSLKLSTTYPKSMKTICPIGNLPGNMI